MVFVGDAPSFLWLWGDVLWFAEAVPGLIEQRFECFEGDQQRRALASAFKH